MFIISLTYKASLTEVERHIEAHIRFLEPYYAQQKFICSGPRNPRTGGVILAYNVTRQEVEEIITLDPFHIHAIADFEIFEFVPTKYDKAFELFVNKG